MQNNHNCFGKYLGRDTQKDNNISDSRITNGNICLSMHTYIYICVCNIYLCVYQLFFYAGYLKAFGSNVFIAKLSFLGHQVKKKMDLLLSLMM